MKGNREYTNEELKNTADRIRADVVRMIGEAGSGHPGGSLSAADIFTALYMEILNVDPMNPGWPERDRFVLAKGHCAPGLYAALAEAGFFPKEELLTLRKLGSRLQGHPDMKRLPGIDISTGSLGQGLSAANGMSLAGKLDGKGYRVYVLLGDGELEEGQVWEAAMTSVHYKLDNLTAFVDHNGLQIDGAVGSVKSLNNLEARWSAWGWNTLTIDGHDFDQIFGAVEQAKAAVGRPTVIIAKTIKGKGVSFMENQVGWHGSAPTREEVERAVMELTGGAAK